MKKPVWKILSFILLILFTLGVLVNLGNIAYWEDEGETIQYGKTILKYGYPSVFDGRSFILLDTNYNPQTFLRYTSPYLQFYLSAASIALFKNPANTFLMRLPFALTALAGVWVSWFWWKKLKFSQFTLFLYTLFISTSIQLYLYWRQARHYALQFPLALGLLYAYLNLNKRKWNILFLVFGFLFYHAYYPGFAGFYLGIVIHALIRKYLDRKYRLKLLVINTLILTAILFPQAVYLKHYGQLPNNGYLNTLAAYLMDINYFGYFKITAISALAIALIKVKRLDLFAKRSNLKKLFIKFFGVYSFSLSLFSLVIVSHLLLASFGAHNQRYISVLIPYLFLLLAASWEKMTTIITQNFHAGKKYVQLLSILILFPLISYSHPKFFLELKSFIRELQSDYSGPIEGIVNTIGNVPSDTLIATNFEDGAIYAYLDNQFLNSLAPTEKYRTGDRLPDWVIIRRHWGQEEYLNSFLQKGNYQKIVTDYCDLSYENVYLVRTHRFQTPACPDSKLIIYKLSPNLF